MKLSEMILPEFDQEMASTQKLLERLPDDKLTWKPHAKSWSMAELTTHIVNLPTWTVMTVQNDSLDMNPPAGESPQPPGEVSSRSMALARFKENVASARATIANASDEQLNASWTLLNGGETVFTLPRVAVLRSFVLNHIIHHRAQLGVYLRMNDVPVPAIYGPTADETGM